MKSLILLCCVLASMLVGCDETNYQREDQALASVNGTDITAMQLNEELQLASVAPGQQDAQSRQLLEALIDRQLLQDEAVRNRLDRDPKVVRTIERTRALIIAQAYLQKKLGAIERPSALEISEYYRRHPEFFAKRKQFDMQQLVFDTRDLTDQAQKAADGAKSLDDMAAWFDASKVKYVRSQATRTTSDLAPELSAKLKSIAPGQLFVVHEGPRSMLINIVEVKDNPASLPLAAPQIENFLFTQRSKDAAEVELARLREVARISYLDQRMAPVPGHAAARGAAGLK